MYMCFYRHGTHEMLLSKSPKCFWTTSCSTDHTSTYTTTRTFYSSTSLTQCVPTEFKYILRKKRTLSTYCASLTLVSGCRAGLLYAHKTLTLRAQRQKAN